MALNAAISEAKSHLRANKREIVATLQKMHSNQSAQTLAGRMRAKRIEIKLSRLRNSEFENSNALDSLENRRNVLSFRCNSK